MLNQKNILAEKVNAQNLTTSQYPEFDLLLCCSLICLSSERSEYIRRLLQKNINWDHLLQLAKQHKVMPILCWNLTKICPEEVPNENLEQLQQYLNDNAQRNEFLTKELLNLLSLLERHGIPAIPYKGPVLTTILYGNSTLRRSVDLDILVHKLDVLKAKDLFIAEGYKPMLIVKGPEGYKPTFQFDSAQEAEFLDSPDQFNYKFKPGADRIALIELHWTITGQRSSLRLDSEWWWDSATSRSFGGTKVLSFLPEDLLLILCMNAMKDQWRYLKGVCDVAELLRVHQDMDWQLVMNRADILRIERILFLGLLLAQTFFGIELPDQVCQRIQFDPVVKLYATKLRMSYFSETNSLHGISENFLFRLLRETPPASPPYTGYLILQFLRLAINPTDEDRRLFSLPVYLHWLYYFVRPVRLVSKYASFISDKFTEITSRDPQKLSG